MIHLFPQFSILDFFYKYNITCKTKTQQKQPNLTYFSNNSHFTVYKLKKMNQLNSKNLRKILTKI